MARIIFTPDQHRCRKELDELGTVPLGTMAECSCGKVYVLHDNRRDGPYWVYVASFPNPPKRA